MTSQTEPMLKMPKPIKKALMLIGVFLLSEIVLSVLLYLTNKENFSIEDFVFLLFTLLFIGFLAFKIKERKNWARITLVALFTIKTIALFGVILGEFLFREITKGIISLIQFVILIVILVFLFNKNTAVWFKEKNIRDENPNKILSVQKVTKTYWFWLIVPLCFIGYYLGCFLNTGGNVIAGLIMVFGPFILGIPLIILLILVLLGLINKNQSLILFSKIGLLSVSFPVSYTIGVIFCH